MRDYGFDLQSMVQTDLEKLEAMKASQGLPMETLNNARELGGYIMKDGRRIKKGRLLRSVALKEASEKDLRTLAEDYHLKLVLDMREMDEIERDPDPLPQGVRWVQTPLMDPEGRKEFAATFQGHQKEAQEEMTDPNDPDVLLDRLIYGVSHNPIDKAYGTYLKSAYAQKGVVTFFREILNTPDGAVLWHCFTGKDRTGIAAGLLMEVLGADWETILADYELSNLYFTSKIIEIDSKVRTKDIPEHVKKMAVALVGGVIPEFLKTAWDFLYAEYGSPLAYLQNVIGLTDQDIESLKERYLESV